MGAEMCIRDIHGTPDRGDTWCVYVVRCRANCWKYSSSDGSLFCCLDSIKERTEMQLGDWNWIQADTPTASGAVMKMLPFLSSGWYFRAATAFLLDRGKISWSQVKFVFSSTAHLPHDAFAPAIEKFSRLGSSTRATLAPISPPCPSTALTLPAEPWRPVTKTVIGSVSARAVRKTFQK